MPLSSFVRPEAVGGKVFGSVAGLLVVYSAISSDKFLAGGDL